MRRLIALVMVLTICLTMLTPVAAVAAEQKKKVYPVDYFTEGKESASRWVEVPGLGQRRYYAQNDRLWGSLLYETKKSPKSRVFSDGGCSPSALAIVIAQMVPMEEMGILLDYAQEPYSLCEHAISSTRCSYTRCINRYYLDTADKIERFLPLVLGDFAMGNNTCHVTSRTEEKGTDTAYIPYIAEIFGLDVRTVTDYEEAMQAMEQGCAIMAYCSFDSCFSSGGHYVVPVARTEERLYILDPYDRYVYTTTTARKVERIVTGVVAVKTENLKYCDFVNFMIFSYKETPAEETSAE